ncbi:MAG: penicillin-binding protein, partial [Clostridiales bacterium]|nr:penicillin-binding protein [Clostridiales bacterium]
MAEKRKGVPDRRANRVILRRTLCLAALFGIGTFSMLIWKLWQIQIVNQDFYETKAIEQQTSDLAVSAKRGTIYDSQGQILAISATAYNVILSPRDLARVQAEYEERPDSDRPAPTNEYLAAGLSELLGTDSETLIKRMERDYSAYEVLASRVEEETAAKVRQFVLDNHLSNGLYVLPDAKRHYPYSSLAAQVIGFVNNENQGAYGIEAARERELAGQRGRVITARTGSGTEMLSSYENYVDAVEGYNLHLTLDATIQYYAERVLEDGIARFEVRNGGFCVVMDPNTGAVYALASSPDYDLNNPRTISDEAAAKQLEAMKNNPAVTEEEYLDALGQAQFKQWWSKALNDTYEPGSTFKTLVLAAALEEGVVNESSTFYCSGSVQVPGWTIRCHKHGGHGSQTLREVVMNSCNPAFVAIGQRLGAEKFYQYLEDFGIIGKTGIDLPEANNSNLVWSREYFTSEEGIASLAAASFGQTFRLTPIQLATAASAAVNGGHLLQPYVVQSVEDENGNPVERHEVIEARQVISEETSALVRSILESV